MKAVVLFFAGVVFALVGTPGSVAQPKKQPSVGNEVKLPLGLKTPAGVGVKIEVKTDAPRVYWLACSEIVQLFASDDGKWVVFVCTKPGSYRVAAHAGGPFAFAAVEVTGEAVPDPKPKPPDPKPKPPDPKPPGPHTGLRVLFVRETSTPLGRAHMLVWSSTRLKTLLDEKCAKTNNRPDWRKWDKDVDTQYENDTLKKLWAATRPNLGQLPAIVVVTDQTGEILPLPDTEQGVMDLISRYSARLKKGGK